MAVATITTAGDAESVLGALTPLWPGSSAQLATSPSKTPIDCIAARRCEGHCSTSSDEIVFA